MEYIQADIWVRFQRMQGHDVLFVGADDAHGAPIMLAAEKAGKKPEDFIAEIERGRKPYLEGFHIAHDTGIRRTRRRTPSARRTSSGA
jgi:methionyl-tRNA synthetase